MLVNLVDVVHLVHLVKWILDVRPSWTRKYFIEIKISIAFKTLFQSVTEKFGAEKILTCIRKNLSCVREKFLVEC